MSLSFSELNLVSMTGFGRAGGGNEDLSLEIEIRAVNSRFLDVICKMPRVYNQFESRIRAVIGQSLNRGRIEVYVTRRPMTKEASGLQLNSALFDGYYTGYQRRAQKHNMAGEAFTAFALRDVLGRSDVFEFVEDPEQVSKEIELLVPVLEEAVESLQTMRAAEGAAIAADVSERIVRLSEFSEEVSKGAEENSEQQKEKLIERLKAAAEKIEIEESRLVTEAALLADKLDVTEEIVRLDSHLEHFSKIGEETPNGRQLEFLLQEIGREINTIGSKVQSAELQQGVVSAKSELEKLREQLANVE